MSSLFLPSNFEKMWQEKLTPPSSPPRLLNQEDSPKKKKRATTLGNQGSDSNNPLMRAIQNLVLSARGQGPEMRMAIDGQEQDVFASPVVPVGPLTSIFGRRQMTRSLASGGLPLGHGVARETGTDIPKAVGNLVGGALDTANERLPEMLTAYSPALVARQHMQNNKWQELSDAKKKTRPRRSSGGPLQQMV